MRIGDEYTSELSEFNYGNHHATPGFSGPTRWGSMQGPQQTWSAPRTGTTPQHPTLARYQAPSYEAEDIVFTGGDRYGSLPRPRSSLYYSPPGTSYTIVESGSSSGSGHARVPAYASSSSTTNKHHGTPQQSMHSSSGHINGGSRSFSNGHKKRPISPEQVLRLFGNANHGHHERNSNHPTDLTASSPSSTTHQSSNHRNQYHPTSVHELATRTVTLAREAADGGHGFGITIKGGKDAGVGVYIARVEEGSVAERAGLRPGDSILEVNGTPFTQVTHEEALKILKTCRKVSMTVRSPTLQTSAMPSVLNTSSNVPSSNYVLRQTCSWMDRYGRPVSPPLEHQRVRPWKNQHASSAGSGCIRRVDICIEPGQSLGLMIRGGIEYNLGIFITGVDKESVADRAGLMVGDQILEVNGQNFLDVTHDEAVNTLKFHKRMTLIVRDVGKVPHSCTAAYDNTGADAWTEPPFTAAVASPPAVPLVSGRKRSAALQMVEEKARCILPKSDFPNLCYYTDEYICKRMTVDAFVSVMLELLNTSEKYTLLTELREIIDLEDRARFDELVYRRNASDHHTKDVHKNFDYRYSSARRKHNIDNNHTFLMSSLHDMSGPAYTCESEPEYRTPSEDSGLGLTSNEKARMPRRPASATPCCEMWYGPPPISNNAVTHPSTSSLQQGTNRRVANTNTTENQDPNVKDYTGDHDEVPGRRGRRHSSPGESRSGSTTALHQPDYGDETNGYLGGLRSWTQKVKSWYWGRPLELANKLSRSFDMKDNANMLTEGSSDDKCSLMRRHQSMQRLQQRGGVGLGSSSAGGKLQDDMDERCSEGARSNNSATVVPDHQGNLRITVGKTKPILGIAIEGGANTKHPLPRIINIHENGAAFEAGGLEVGQLILEVDGQRVEGLQHQEVARLIAESFARRDKIDIEFLVVEAKKSNLEPKPTALIFLEA